MSDQIRSELVCINSDLIRQVLLDAIELCLQVLLSGNSRLWKKAITTSSKSKISDRLCSSAAFELNDLASQDSVAGNPFLLQLGESS